MVDHHRNRKKASFFRLYVLFPTIVFSQIIFVSLLTRNIKTLRTIPPEERIKEKKVRSLSSFQQESRQGKKLHTDAGFTGDDRTLKLLERLRRERDEIETQKTLQKVAETGKEDESRPSKQQENSNQQKLEELKSGGEDWKPIVRTFELRVPKAEESNSVGEDLKPGTTSFEERALESLEAKVDEKEKKPPDEFADRLLSLRDDLLKAAVSAAGIEKAAQKNDTTNVRQYKPVKPPPDQPIDFLTPFLAPPRIVPANATTIVLVPSHQGSFVKREAIRETWKSVTNNRTSTTTVLFVVAHSDCQEFNADLNVNTTTFSERNISSPACADVDHEFLQLEQGLHNDLLEIPMQEKYDRLSEKMMQAYNWVVNNVPNVKWVAKADDDMFVDVENLEKYVRKYNFEIPMVIGDIVYHSRVAREGKWAEADYPNLYYPYWPKGSAGHVLSRPAVEYLTKNSESLHRYQGEDTNIGIWFDEARKSGRLKDVTYIHAPETFISFGKVACDTGSKLVPVMVGHEFTPGDQMYCHKAASSNGGLDNSWHDAPSNFEQLIKEENAALEEELGHH